MAHVFGEPRRALQIAAALLLVLEVAALLVQRDWARGPFVTIALLQGAVYATVLFALRDGRSARTSLAFVLTIAAALRVGPLLGPVIWSSDIYRYVWDGIVQMAGINPYCCIPEDPALAHLRDEAIFPSINRRDFARTIYPPVAQMAFALQAWLGATVLTMKSLFVALEALGIVAMLVLLRRLQRPSQQILIYAWHPLPVWEIAGSGHVDALIVAFIPLALIAALSGRRVLAGVALGAAVLTKFIPLVLFPALWRRWDWKMPLAFVVFVVACYLPYFGVGARVLGYLPDYTNEEHLAPGSGTGFWIVDTVRRLFGVDVPAVVYLGLGALLMSALALRAMYRADSDESTLQWAMVLGLGTMLLFSPHYAWYFVWVVMLLTLSPWAPGLWPTLTAFLLYWDPEGGRVPTWVGTVMYGGFAVLAIAGLVRSRILTQTVGENHGASRTA